MSICSTSAKFDGPLTVPLVVSPADAMRMLGCARATLYALLKRGELQSYSEGTSRKIVVASIHALIQRRVAASATFTPARSPRKPRTELRAAAAAMEKR
jgi:hypothetical protein